MWPIDHCHKHGPAPRTPAYPEPRTWPILPLSAYRPLYPMLAHASIARRRNAAASRLLVQALGPWTGGDGPAACRPLPCSTTPPPPSDKPASSNGRYGTRVLLFPEKQ